MQVILNGRAFLTGSQAYGEPRKDSDIDLVVFSDPTTIGRILSLSQSACELDYGLVDSASVRFGELNIIFHSKDADFRAWEDATRDLIAKRPVSRDEAVQAIKAKIALYRDIEQQKSIS